MSASHSAMIDRTNIAGIEASRANSILQLRVTERTMTAENIVAFVLQSADGMPLPEFSAGAHLEILCQGVQRHYSLCSDPHDPMHYMIAVQYEASGRGGSRYLVDEVKEGDILEASLPRNHFHLHQAVAGSAGTADSTLLIAGGIGITPLLAMAWTLHHADRPFHLYDFAGSLPRQAFKDQIEQMPWHSHVTRQLGRCVDFTQILGTFESGKHVYVCGPFALIEAVLQAARTMGWPTTHQHFERFSAPPSNALGNSDSATQSLGGHSRQGSESPPQTDIPFEVEIASTGKRIPIASDQSVCAALSATGITVPMSCEHGVCGACLTRVLAGTPDHRDWILSPEEQAANDRFTPCCSRSLSSLLVLDL